MRAIRTTIVTIAFLAAASTAAAAQSTIASARVVPPTQEGHFHEGEIGEKLMTLESALKCDCGCGLDVHSCQFQMQCGTSPVWSQRIRAALERGESVEAIQAGFVAEFGPTVLMAPPPEGFNLVGYLLPAIAIITAGMLVGLLARGGMRTATLAPVEAPSEEEEAKLAAALKKLDELESPDW